MHRCRQNLRVVLCCAASEDGGLLARRLRKFPALAYNMTAVTLNGWDIDACQSVAEVRARLGKSCLRAAKHMISAVVAQCLSSSMLATGFDECKKQGYLIDVQVVHCKYGWFIHSMDAVDACSILCIVVIDS